MSNTDLQNSPSTSTASTDAPRNNRKTEQNGNDQNQRSNQRRTETRAPITNERVLQEVEACLRADRRAGGRILAATGRNAVVMAARSSLGQTLFGASSDVDRAMFIVERESAKGFDVEKITKRADFEKRLYEHLSAICTITAEIIVQFKVEDFRDPLVKKEVSRIKSANALTHAASEQKEPGQKKGTKEDLTV